MKMRNFKALIAGLACSVGLFAQPLAHADDAPIHLVVGAPPGGTTDAVARGLGQQMALLLKRPVVIDNRPGAGGNIASDYVAKSAPDGNTLLVSFTGFSINASLYKNLPFDPELDFTPISMLAYVPSVLAANRDFPANDMQQLIALVKAHPGKYTMALGAIGSSLHLAGERMKMMAGLNILNVPYKGTAPALTDLLGGQVDLMFASSINVMPHVKSGRLKLLGVTSPEPMPQFPGVEPIGKTVPGFQSNAWFALFGPAGMQPAILDEMNRTARGAVDTPAFRHLLEPESAEAHGSTPQELRDFVHDDIQRYAEVVKFTGAKAE